MKGMYLGRRFYRQMFGLVLVMILAPEDLAAQDAIATALDRIHREYSSGPMDTARLVLLDRELRELIPHYSWQERPWLRATYLKVGYESIGVHAGLFEREYSSGPMDTARLVLLDRELRELIPHYSWQERPWLRATYLKVGYESIGVHAGLFERDFLIYSGELLTEAHSNDPNSPFRSHTLYSTIFGREGRRSTDMPSPDAAEAYVNEFPQGPFIVEVHLILAGFYDDLYKVLTLEEDGRRIAYKYDCYKAYLTVEPLPEQRRIARESAIRHYERLVELLPLYADFKRYLVDLREDRTHGWFNCGD